MRKDGAFKGERTSWLEEKEGGRKKRRIREGVDESHLAIPFVLQVPFLHALLRRPTMRLHRYKRDMYADEISSFQLYIL